MKKWKIITGAVVLVLAIATIISTLANADKIFLIVESASLTVTIGIDFTLNLFFIRHVDKVEIKNAGLIKIAEANGINVNDLGSMTINKLVTDSFVNYDDKIMESVMGYMDDFEYEVANGGFSIYGPFNVSLLLKPEQLRRSIGTASFVCRDDKLNQYLLKLRSELQIIGDLTSFHSFPIPTPGFNKMKWVEMEEEQTFDKKYEDGWLQAEKKAFDDTEKAIIDALSIYKEMIEYWKKNRKVAE